VFKTKASSGRRSSAAVLMQLTFARIAALGLAGTLAACGGGGGGGGNSGGGSGRAGDTPLSYSGKTTPAVITTTNAAQLTANIVGGVNPTGALSSVAPGSEGGGAKELERQLTRAIRARPSILRSGSRRVTAEPFDQTETCDGGRGTVRVFGDVSQSGPGTENFVWTNCLTGDTTLNGSASLTVRVFDQVFGILDGTFNFVRVSLASPTVSGTASGEMLLQVDPAANKETTTSKLITLEADGRMTMADPLNPLVVEDVFTNLSDPTSSFVEKITGRLFDSLEGFVDITTTTPLAFGSPTQLFASSGEIILTGATVTGAGSRRVRVVAASSNVVKLDLDLDGDGTFEGTAFLKWTELTGPVGADLADTDHDGMHNSWERVNGFDPINPQDPSLDTDMDGATDLAEYRAGTNPRDPMSVP
jgi:hypothetical protein